MSEVWSDPKFCSWRKGDSRAQVPLDLAGEWSGGVAMSDTPPDPEDEEFPYPESRFLASLWDRTDRIEELSCSAGSMTRLPEILALLEEAAELVRQEIARVS